MLYYYTLKSVDFVKYILVEHSINILIGTQPLDVTEEELTLPGFTVVC